MLIKKSFGTGRSHKFKGLAGITPIFVSALMITSYAFPTYADSVDDAIEAIENSNFDLALELLSEPLEREDPRAQYYFGRMHIGGNSVPQDIGEAFNWILRAANNGLADAQHDAGVMYLNGEGTEADHGKAVNMFTLAAEQGNEGSQFNLGLIYSGGYDLPTNYEAAVKWYSMAANQGYAIAQFNLGSMLLTGVGVDQNYDQAFELLELAAKQGLADAQYNLGAIYLHEPAGKFDLKLAYLWTGIAAKNGYEDPTSLMDRIAQNLSSDDLRNATKLSHVCMASNYENCEF